MISLMWHVSFRVLKICITLALILAFIVISLGAYTRLTDAGLGCPDWPGCYGYTYVPSKTLDKEKAQVSYPDQPIETKKAWTEMVHRYAAFLLVFLIGISCVLSYRIKAIYVMVLGVGVWIIFQALLGMWTVTWRLLPQVVLMHLLSGALLFAGLLILRFRLSCYKLMVLPAYSTWLALAAWVVFIQIGLGGWVSANYAGIACQGFPTCYGAWWPVTGMSIRHALAAFTQSLGVDYQGGLLSYETRVTIQVIHRAFAVVVILYVGGLMMHLYWYMKNQRWQTLAIAVSLLLCIQISLGIINVVYWLPLPAAVLHNSVAVFLFSLLGMMWYASRTRS